MSEVPFSLKKQPRQSRARFTVSVIKEATAHILQTEGLAGFTTNAVADKAGVSIGSLYQYFPSKDVLIAELKREHFAQLRQLMGNAYAAVREGTLEEVVEAFIRASVAAHQQDPELHRVLSGDLVGFTVKEDDEDDDSVRHMVEGVLFERRHELRDDLNVPLAAKLSYTIVEQVVHDAALNQPAGKVDDQFVGEVRRIIIAYLRQ
jgi:AcrR family transcriptional regulator